MNIPFTRLSRQPDIWFTQSTLLWFARMLRPIEHQDLPTDRLGRDEIWVLGHIPGTVDLARMVDPLDDVDSGRGRDCVTTQLAALIIILCAVDLV